ncbi:hypothetical protein [Pseudomonas sp. Z3-8]|uniref:hypothetical protein n=1 Tax=Pseudomonas sp. Z3-8 TaxID=2817412 RepID=UPI003DA850F9
MDPPDLGPGSATWPGGTGTRKGDNKKKEKGTDLFLARKGDGFIFCSGVLRVLIEWIHLELVAG